MNMISKIVLLLVFLPAAFAQSDPNVQGLRSVYVHLFEWKWLDIAAECERFLGPKGYAGVQVSPPNEHRVIPNPHRPWWERYQPVSYRLVSRSGTEAEFADMVKRCNKAGVRIYVDAVINHMGSGAGKGIAESYYNSSTLEYEGVPFTSADFTPASECPTPNENNQSYDFHLQQARGCALLGMPDLVINSNQTRGKILQYLNSLIDLGVAGFRIDAAKHMWPRELKALLDDVKNLSTAFFAPNSRPFVYHEVIDLGGEPLTGVSNEYTGFGRVTEFKFGRNLSQIVQRPNGEMLKYLRDIEKSWGLLPGAQAVSFIDNHDNQRGHGSSGNIILTFRKARQYKIANAFMLAHPYGFSQVMSSYFWPMNCSGGTDKNDWIGPPSDKDGNTFPVHINANGSCANGWVCEHRWRQIVNMVEFRNVAGAGQLVHWWDNSANQIAFGRGSHGNTTAFIVINNDDVDLHAQLKTGLPPGIYCDVISGDKDGNICTGKSITVEVNRTANFIIAKDDEDPIFAIHVNTRINSARLATISVNLLLTISGLLFFCQST